MLRTLKNVGIIKFYPEFASDYIIKKIVKLWVIGYPNPVLYPHLGT